MMSNIGHQKHTPQKNKYMNWKSSTLKKLLCLKGHHQESEKPIHRMEKNVINHVSSI